MCVYKQIDKTTLLAENKDIKWEKTY